MDGDCLSPRISYMARKKTGKAVAPDNPGNSIRAWRGDLSLERLADRVRDLGVPITHASLSRIERGLQPYTQVKLEAIAKALNCTPADLVMRTPTSPTQIALILAITNMGDEERKRALKILQAMTEAA